MRIRELDGLRAIAALAVIAHHYIGWIKYSGSGYGWLGVDLFFVLSGFLITSILLDLKNKRSYFTTFYARRSFRIFPPYYFMLSIYLVISLLFHYHGTVGFWAKYLFYYASLLFFSFSNTEYNGAVFCKLGLGVLWSLSVEELFYLIWAPAVRFLDRRRFSLLLAFMIVAAPVCRWLLHSHSPEEVFTFYCRMDGLAFGALVAVIEHRRRAGTPVLGAADAVCDRAWVALGIAFAAYFAIAGPDYHRASVTVVGVSIANLFFASMVYYIVRHSGEGAAVLRGLRWKPLRSIGTVSYGLYLVHYPLLIGAVHICAYFHLARRANAIMIDLVALALTFGAAYGMWYGFESYALRLKDRLFPSPVELVTGPEPALAENCDTAIEVA